MSGPKVHVRGGARDAAVQRGIGDILVSISHCRTYATATAIAMAIDPDAPKPTEDED